MRHVAVIALAAVAVTAAATTSIQVSRGQAVSLEQSRIQQQALLQRLDRLEQRVAAAPGPQPVPMAAVPQSGAAVAPGGPPKPARESASSPQHTQQLQTASALVDRGIQGGQWSMSDMTELAVATRGLSAEERNQLMSRLTMAINSDRVKFDHRRIPGH